VADGGRWWAKGVVGRGCVGQVPFIATARGRPTAEAIDPCTPVSLASTRRPDEPHAARGARGTWAELPT